MPNKLRTATLLLAAASLVLGTGKIAQAYPEISEGRHCAACHNEAFPDVLDVNGDGVLGGLETFDARPGETVQLSFTVTEEEGLFDEWEYMMGVNGLELTGLDPDVGSDWEHRPDDFVSYVLKDDYEDDHTFTLEVLIDPTMPFGIYPLGAVVAGPGEIELPEGDDEILWSASVPFNLRVVPEPSTLMLALTLAASSVLALSRHRRKA